MPIATNSARPHGALTFTDLNDSGRIAAAQGFEVGKYVVQKMGGPTTGVFKIQSIESNPSTCKLVDTQTHRATEGEPIIETVDYSTLCKKWRLHTFVEPSVVDDASYAPLLFEGEYNDDVKLCNAHADTAQTLYEFACEHVDAYTAIEWRRDPKRIVVTKRFKTGDFVLVPYTTSGRITHYTDPEESANVIRNGDYRFKMTPPPSPHMWTIVGHTHPENAMLVPYWHVRITSKGETHNLEKSIMEINTCSIPCLVNTRVLKVGDVLVQADTRATQAREPDVRTRKAAELGVASLDGKKAKQPKGSKASGANPKGGGKGSGRVGKRAGRGAATDAGDID